jgi:hypothetical protein
MQPTLLLVHTSQKKIKRNITSGNTPSDGIIRWNHEPGWETRFKYSLLKRPVLS